MKPNCSINHPEMQIIKKITRPVALASVFAYASCSFAQPKPAEPESPAGKGFAVVELFTSEGCSSCPPADRLIGELQAEDPDAPLYILAYHVDYWDHQGWKDRFSSPAYSLRQHRYAQWMGLETVYTPQMVVNGQKEFVGSDARAGRKAIGAALNTAPEGNLTLQIIREQDLLKVHYQFVGATGHTSMLLALVQKKAESMVTAGENNGRRLPHVQVVRELKEEDCKSNGDIQIKMPSGFSGEGWELIAFVQNKKDGKIIAATKTIITQ